MATIFGNDYALVDAGDAAGLASAIAAANDTPRSPYNVFLQASTYDVMETLVVYGKVRLYGQGVDVTIIRQGQQDPDLMAGIFTLNDEASVECHNLTIKDGLAQAPQYGAVDGGAFKIWSGSLSIHDSKLQNNAADNQGGAIYNIDGSVDIRRSSFIGNQALTGGAIHTNSEQNPDLTIECARFEENSASESGGVLMSTDGTGITIRTSSFLDNNVAAFSGNYITNLDDPDVDAQSNWWEPSPTVPTWVNDDVDTSSPLGSDPSSSCVMKSAKQTFIDELSDYGITAYVEGNPTMGDEWSIDELYQVLIGVQYVARALNLHKNDDASGTNQQAKDLFQTVMGNLSFLSVENGFEISTGDDCNGTTDQACTSNNNSAIIFYGNVNITQYTVVHELGHRFDNRSDQGGNDSLSERLGRTVGGIIITDCDSERVLGEIDGEWERGNRGWGSGPGFSDFQQDPLNEAGLTDEEIWEAAADMFLNWVYRRNTDQAPTGSPCSMPATGSWEGFLNLDWLSNPNGATDYTRKPGNARYQWMEDTIFAIFYDQQW